MVVSARDATDAADLYLCLDAATGQEVWRHLLNLRKVLDMYEVNGMANALSVVSSPSRVPGAEQAAASLASNSVPATATSDDLLRVVAHLQKRKADGGPPFTPGKLQTKIKSLHGTGGS